MWRKSRRKVGQSAADRQWREELLPAVTAAKEERARRLTGREDVVADLEALLFERDPIGLNFEDNTDEYRAEAETITLRLPEAGSAADVMAIVHQEFVQWFSADVAGPPERYGAIAEEIWLRHGGQT